MGQFLDHSPGDGALRASIGLGFMELTSAIGLARIQAGTEFSIAGLPNPYVMNLASHGLTDVTPLLGPSLGKVVRSDEERSSKHV